jgi:hypothetical protein
MFGAWRGPAVNAEICIAFFALEFARELLTPERKGCRRADNIPGNASILLAGYSCCAAVPAGSRATKRARERTRTFLDAFVLQVRYVLSLGSTIYSGNLCSYRELPRLKFEPLDSDEGQLLIHSLTLSSSHPKE